MSDPSSDQLSAIEQRLRRSLEDESSVGKPLSRRARQTKRSVEAYLRAERRWRARASGWRLDRVNQLIREHNQWYPVETGLPMDPRTGDYVRRRGRSYRRAEVGPEWILERFPPTLEPVLR